MAVKQRSPRAPSIDLEAALERARVLYQEEGANAAPVDTVLRHWGYNSRNGRSLTLLASVKQYGLIEDEGAGDKRRVRLTPQALKIIRDPREKSPERDAAIQQLALVPKVHQRVLAAFPEGLPSDDTLQWHLIEEEKFTDTGAREFVNQFRRTIDFARLTPSAIVDDQDEDNEVPADTLEKPLAGQETPGDKPDAGGGGKGKSFTIPLDPSEDAQLSFSGPVTQAKWDRFMTILEAMKPSIIVLDEAHRAAPASDD